jgi:hypothetical protein
MPAAVRTVAGETGIDVRLNQLAVLDTKRDSNPVPVPDIERRL